MKRRAFHGRRTAALAAGCSAVQTDNPHIRVEDFQTYQSGDPEIRIACVGDKHYLRAGIQDREKYAYPAQLSLVGTPICRENLPQRCHRQSQRRPSHRTTEYQELEKFQPEVVILMLGTNDTKPQNWKGREVFEQEYRSLIAGIRDLKSRPKIWACFLLRCTRMPGASMP